MKLLYLSLAWLLLASGVLLTSVAAVQFLNLQKVPAQITITPSAKISTGTQLPEESSIGLSTVKESADARAQLVTNFLARHNSPLTPHEYYGAKLVEIADQFGIDFRLLPAIAMQESNLCKVIPEGSYNCLGFGIHSRGTLHFESYEANFVRAARELKANYIDIGLTSPEQIMRKYTPSSNGSWAASVNQWMAEMRYDDRQKGRTEKTDADVLEFVEPSPEATQ